MALTIQQESVYLIIFNATMILRSVRRSIKGEGRLRDFKVSVFREIEKLTDKMDTNTLTEEDIINSIDNLVNEFGISFGQAQKPINVILKYHFYLTKSEEEEIKKKLHCPIDSVILERLGKSGLPLTWMNKEMYLKIQKEIENRGNTRIEFDTQWDKQHLRDEGLL